MRDQSPRRAMRPAITQAKIYRTAVPAALLILATAAVILLILAAGVFLGLVPYPGK